MARRDSKTHHGKRGFVLPSAGVCAVALVSCLGDFVTSDFCESGRYKSSDGLDHFEYARIY